MTPEQYQRAKSIFLELCDLPSNTRAARLAELVADDQPVRDQVLRMLENDQIGDLDSGGERARRQMEAMLESSFGSGGAAAGEPVVPEFIGRYRVVRAIGSGGMGDVFEARQETPNRRVAVKLMRSGIASQSLIRRFRREVEFIGRLSHPGIAQVYEAGVATIGASSVPFYAMEFVNGLPLTAFARKEQLTDEQKLRLFASICDIVQYAHQQGVIHRDLKPANILVTAAHTQHDGAETARIESVRTGDSAANTMIAPEFRAKVLDFGIARAVEPETGTATIATEAGQIIGTIPYMSPEQIAGKSADIDTRTDVYALGVILFELLAGRYPHDLHGMSLVEAARIKADTSPVRLSTVDRRFRGDLEAIVGKALETEKRRRYASASELAQDVRRYLGNEVVAARPATAIYQMRKFARRNRAVVAAGGLALAALIAGLIATAVQMQVARRERDTAVRKTQVAEGVSKVLLNAFTTATPRGTPGREARLIDAIDKIEAQANDEDRTSNPEVRAIILNVAGIIHRERGEYERAERNFLAALEIRRQVLDASDPNIADSLNNMGLLRKRQERYADAGAYYQQAVDLQRRSSFQDDERLARNIYNLASAYISAGELQKAKPLLEESLAMHRELRGEADETIGFHVSAQGRIAAAEGRWDDAKTLAERALAMQREAVGPSHPSIVTALIELAAVRSHEADHDAAVTLLKDADAMARSIFSFNPDHPLARDARSRLLSSLRAAGRTQEASELERGGQSPD